MKVVVTAAFIIIVLFAIFPAIMKWVLWGLVAAIVIFIFIAAPSDNYKVKPKQKEKDVDIK